MKMIARECVCPIDFWIGAMRSEEIVEAAQREGDRFGDDGQYRRSIVDLMNVIEQAAHPVFRRLGWEGDIRSGPYWFFVPHQPFDVSLGYALKQDNNGQTFVAVPEVSRDLYDGSVREPITFEI